METPLETAALPLTGQPDRAPRLWGRSPFEWFFSLPTIGVLLLVLVIGTGEMIHGQLLKLGESMFSDSSAGIQYFMLRADPVRPTCNPTLDVDTELGRAQAAPAAKGDDIDALFGGDSQFDPEAHRRSLVDGLALCQRQHAHHARVTAHMGTSVQVYRLIETRFFELFRFGSENRPMILLVLLAVSAIATTLGYHHICLRPPRFTRDYQMQNGSMAVACGLLLLSAVRYYDISLGAGVPIDEPWLYRGWIAMFGALLAINLYRLFKADLSTEHGLGTWGRSLQSAPLIAQMGIFAGVYFLLHGHPSGLAIYVNKLMDLPNLPLQLALYIWAGMLLKQSRVVDLFMNILRPWKLSPETLTYVIMLGAAIPTAYSGASGVFVIAAGAVIYHEVRAAGGRSQYALAATAMSGSLGVVLRPSLLVVGIAAINKEVTTTHLFHWGVYVFVLTSTMFFVASQFVRTERSRMAPVGTALPEMLRQLKPVLPYVLLTAVVIKLYGRLLDTPLNEISAPIIMPVIMLAVLILDKFLQGRRTPGTTGAVNAKEPAVDASGRPHGIEASIRMATNDTVGHIGAYIMLMALSQTVGGMVERSEVIALAPQHFDNIWMAMAFLMVAKVLLGMVMEPIGAIFLVSGTLAPIAYHNGIDPVHFWMMVLVAFELGYLLPPVAINQLLTRQVVGEAAIQRSDAEAQSQMTFFMRHERWTLPILVMSVSLLIVGFGPLAVQQWPWLNDLLHIATTLPK